MDVIEWANSDAIANVYTIESIETCCVFGNLEMNKQRIYLCFA